MEQEVIEVTLQVTVDSGYPRENAPLEHEIRAFAERLDSLTGIHDVEATATHSIDLTGQSATRERLEIN